MAERKLRMALLSRYSKLHNERYGERPSLNINTEQWAADCLIESYGMEECYDLLQYYFDAAQTPTWKFFANYADRVLEARQRVEQDKIERAQMRRKAKEWVNE